MRRKGLATTPPTPPLPPPPPAIRVRNGCVVAYGQTVSGWRQCCRIGSDQRTDGRPRRPRAAAVASIVRSSSSPPPSRVLLVRTADRGPVSAGVGAVARHRRRHCQGQMGSNVEEEVARFPVASLPTWQPIMYSRSRLSIRVKIFKLTSWLISVSLLCQRRGCGRRGKYDARH